MKSQDLSSKSIAELDAMASALSKQYKELKFKMPTTEIKQSHKFGNLRKQIAQIHTLRRQKELVKEVENA